MKDPALIGLAALFILCGVISAYYLVLGLREGRIGRRFNFPYPGAPLPGGREPGYAYRDLHPSLFWTEAAMQVVAVLACLISLFVLFMAP